MRILLTNDDGYYAPGLQILYEKFQLTGLHSITVSAPEKEQSAKGHSITLFDPLYVKEHSLKGNDKGFEVNGTPSDSVKIAVQGELIEKPDLVISGINRGYNLGTDIFYSGTVSAAMEGVFLGIKAIAVSTPSQSNIDYDSAALWLSNNHFELIQMMEDTNIILLNLNFPPNPPEDWRGIKVTRLCKTEYDNVFESRIDPHGRKYYWQAGTLKNGLEEETDICAVGQGYISVTPLHYDLTDYAKMEAFKNSLKIMQ